MWSPSDKELREVGLFCSFMSKSDFIFEQLWVFDDFIQIIGHLLNDIRTGLTKAHVPIDESRIFRNITIIGGPIQGNILKPGQPRMAAQRVHIWKPLIFVILEKKIVNNIGMPNSVYCEHSYFREFVFMLDMANMRTWQADECIHVEFENLEVQESGTDHNATKRVSNKWKFDVICVTIPFHVLFDLNGQIKAHRFNVCRFLLNFIWLRVQHINVGVKILYCTLNKYHCQRACAIAMHKDNQVLSRSFKINRFKTKSTVLLIVRCFVDYFKAFHRGLQPPNREWACAFCFKSFVSKDFVSYLASEIFTKYLARVFKILHIGLQGELQILLPVALQNLWLVMRYPLY